MLTRKTDAWGTKQHPPAPIWGFSLVCVLLNQVSVLTPWCLNARLESRHWVTENTKKKETKKKREGYFHLCCGNVHFKLAGVFEIKKNKQKGHEPDRTASALSWGLCVCVCKLCWVFHWWCSLLNISAATAKLFKANLWFVGWNKTGFGVMHLWAYRYWLKIKCSKKWEKT